MNDIASRLNQLIDTLELSNAEFGRRIGVSRSSVSLWTNGINLRALMKSNNVTQDRLAEIAEVSRQSVSQWLNKETLPTLQSVLLIAQHFEVTVEQLVYCSKSNLSSYSIPRRFFPICTGIKNGKVIIEQNWCESYMISNNIPVDADFCFIMYDDSMSKSRIEKGDIVVIKETQNVHQNDFVLCAYNDSLILRRYFKTDNNDIMLIASNRDYPNFVVHDKSKFQLLGVATAFRGRL